MKFAAYFSDDRRYRYWLTRSWDDALPMMCVIGINPSTADESVDDPTIRKCIGFAQRSGFGGLLMLNVGAYRASDPRKWLQAADPFGPENSISHLRTYLARFTPTWKVAAWGKNGHKTPMVLSRCLAIAHTIPELQCWGRNPDGSPRHPLMLSYSTKLEFLAAPPSGLSAAEEEK